MNAQEWTTDVNDRVAELTKLAALSGGGTDQDGFYWGAGRYHIVHFDLITIDENDKRVDRNLTYQTVHDVIAKRGGFKLGGSVYAVPLVADADAKPDAATVWNAICGATAGQLMEGDVIFVHYSSATKNKTGCIAQVILAAATTLASVQIPA